MPLPLRSAHPFVGCRVIEVIHVQLSQTITVIRMDCCFDKRFVTSLAIWHEWNNLHSDTTEDHCLQLPIKPQLFARITTQEWSL